MPSQFYMVQRLLCLNTDYAESNLTCDSLATERKDKSLQKVMYNSVLIDTVCAFTEQENTNKKPQSQACSSEQMFIQLQLKHGLCFNSIA